MFQKACVPQHLQLLANLVLDMAIVRMEGFKLTTAGINVLVGKFRFAEAADDIQNIQRPAARFGGNRLKALCFLELFPNLGGGCYHLGFDQFNSRIHRDAVQRNIAADPAGAAGGGGQCVAADDGGRRKGKARDQQQMPDSPRQQFILEEKEIGRFIAADGAEHGFIRAVINAAADRALLAFELIPISAVRTLEITRLRIVRQPLQAGGRAIRAVKIVFAPKLRDHPRPLRTAGISGGEIGGHGEVHRGNSINE